MMNNGKRFEDTMRDAIIEAYISVMGAGKWNSLTNGEKDMALHLVENDFGKRIGAKRA